MYATPSAFAPLRQAPGYGYDVAHRLTSEQTNGGTAVSLGYDLTNQLTSATGGRTESYGFDLAGNRNTTDYQTGTGNRLLNDGTYAYTYNDEGARDKKTLEPTAETWTYGYDHDNRLLWARLAATDGGAATLTVTYTYDAFGQRVQEDRWTAATGVVTTRFAFDGANIWADLNNANQLLMRRLYLDGVDQVFARLSAAGTAVWYAADRQGSITDYLDANGVTKYHFAYDSFGNATGSGADPSIADRLRYTGKEYDQDTKLQLHNWRWYDPRTGRWVNEDPIGLRAGDPNLHRYVGNSPTNATDPSGQELIVAGDEQNMRAVQDKLWRAGIQYRSIELPTTGRLLLDLSLNDSTTLERARRNPDLADLIRAGSSDTYHKVVRQGQRVEDARLTANEAAFIAGYRGRDRPTVNGRPVDERYQTYNDYLQGEEAYYERHPEARQIREAQFRLSLAASAVQDLLGVYSRSVYSLSGRRPDFPESVGKALQVVNDLVGRNRLTAGQVESLRAELQKLLDYAGSLPWQGLAKELNRRGPICREPNADRTEASVSAISKAESDRLVKLKEQRDKEIAAQEARARFMQRSVFQGLPCGLEPDWDLWERVRQRGKEEDMRRWWAKSDGDRVIAQLLVAAAAYLAPAAAQWVIAAPAVGGTVKVYRKMSLAEAEKAIASKELPPRIAGSNSNKYVSESLSKVERFQNTGVAAGTKEVIVEFELDAAAYARLRASAIPQQGSAGSGKIVFNTEGLGGTELVNLGIPESQLANFNKAIIKVRLAE